MCNLCNRSYTTEPTASCGAPGVYQNRGYEPYVTNETVDGQMTYRVRIGQFESFNDAKALKNELGDKYSIEPWIDFVSR